jgi:hypothetical protein
MKIKYVGLFTEEEFKGKDKLATCKFSAECPEKRNEYYGCIECQKYIKRCGRIYIFKSVITIRANSFKEAENAMKDEFGDMYDKHFICRESGNEVINENDIDIDLTKEE